MGDLLGSPRVAAHFRCLFFCPFFRPPSGARHPRPGSSSPAGRASGRQGSNTRRWAPQGLSGGGPSVCGRVLMIIACAYNGRCDHTSTNAPEACLGESSTWMGELLGSPRVAPHFRCLFYARSSGLPRACGTPVPEAHHRRVGHPEGGAPIRGEGPRKASRAAAPPSADACL
ncbi:hypothetical protein PIB30_111337 [Stylosanthes scabra]|uniref:Uncharacterized protein n=1 Tax=Stylosanthes scabra TaxID=79078 RepID=A0ABU6X0B7_9FABA|nr:hypothetical protein [Stylosanthes scabra]